MSGREIEIKSGELYFNRTLRYLIPTLKDWGEEFKSRFSSMWLLASGIGDDLHQHDDYYIYCLIDIHGFKRYGQYLNKQKAIANFYRNRAFFKEQEYYIDDYAYDEPRSGNKHMFVFDIPDYFRESCIFEKFKEGKYSSLFNNREIKRLIKKTVKTAGIENISDVYKIITKDPAYNKTFAEFLNEEFGTTITKDDIKGELDIPPILSQEIFNYGHRKEEI